MQRRLRTLIYSDDDGISSLGEVVGKIRSEIEAKRKKEDRIFLDKQYVAKIVGEFFSMYNSSNGEVDIFEKVIDVNLDGCKRRMKFYTYVNRIFEEEIKRIEEGFRCRVRSIEDLIGLLGWSELPEDIRGRLRNSYLGDYLTRRFDRGHVLLRGSRWKSRRY